MEMMSINIQSELLEEKINQHLWTNQMRGFKWKCHTKLDLKKTFTFLLDSEMKGDPKGLWERPEIPQKEVECIWG